MTIVRSWFFQCNFSDMGAVALRQAVFIPGGTPVFSGVRIG